MRYLNIFLVFSVVALAFLIYQVSYETRAHDHSIAALRGEIEQERDAIALARAEWSLLNRPERIERLASKFLNLQPAKAEQLVSYAAMARPPAVVQQAVAQAVRPAPAVHRVTVSRVQ